MRVLVACEFSGVVREAFRAAGHEAYSCDLLPSEIASPYHFQTDVRDVLDLDWGLMIAHPPCTHLSVSGARHFWRKEKEQAEGLEFVSLLLNAPIPRIALENPVSIISSRIRKPDQIIHPWEYGHPEQKTTCLWLKNLPRLRPTKNVRAQMLALPQAQRERVLWMGRDHGQERSVTFQGFADAMAAQWGEEGSVQLEMAL